MPSQTTRELSASLKKGEIAPVYYLHGAEDILKDEAAGAILDRALDPAFRDFNYDQRSASQLDPEAVEALCNTLPMMAERRVVMIRDVEAWKRKTRARSAMLAYLKSPSPDTVVILVQGSGEETEDKELAKHAVSVACNALSPKEAQRWLERQAGVLGVTLGPGAAEHLLKCTGCDLGAIRAELEKLASLPAGSTISAEQVADLVGIRHGETKYDWRDAVLDRKAERAVTLLERVLDQPGVSGVGLVSLLGTTLVGVGVVRAAFDRKTPRAQLGAVAMSALRAGRPFGLGPWNDEVERWARWAPEWPAARLREALRSTLEADRALKSTRLSDDRGLLADLVMQLTLTQVEVV